MTVRKTLREIDYDLPNGFHDAKLETVTLNFPSNRADLDLQLSVGSPDDATEEEREAYKWARLHLTDLVYFVIDCPDPGRVHPEGEALWIDAGDATDESLPAYLKPPIVLPAEAFAYWFYVHQWNAHFHVAAKGASLEWI